MSVQVKRRRDTAANLATFVGAQAELLVDTTNNRVQVHDGTTAGGWPAAKLAEVLTNTRTAVADTAYTALATDRTVAFTSLSAPRVVTLPAASAYPTGTRLVVFDESGLCSATLTITIEPAGSDTIDGATSAVLSSAYGYLALQSNGSGKWTIVDQAASNLSAVGIGTPADPNNVLSVYGASALFSSAGSFNITVNKGASSNTGSFIFEDGFSGRAQIGLCGDDNFHFKVSPNGSTWYDALDITASSGLVTAKFGLALAGSTSGTTQLQASATASGTLTLPAATDTLAVLGTNQTFSATETFSGTLNVTGTFQIGGYTMSWPAASGTVVTIAASQTLTNKTLTNPVISGGTIDNAIIGGTTAAAASFTSLSASGTVSGAGFSNYLASPPAIGGAISADYVVDTPRG
jgi:hypothetical protein